MIYQDITNNFSFWDKLSTGTDPGNQPWKQGYDVAAATYHPDLRTAAYGLANATLCDGQSYRPLFVTGVNLDIGLAGSAAQSRFTRDFYPKNFVQPSFIIEGQALDQRDYGGLCDFVHHMQRRMLGLSLTSGLLQLNITPRPSGVDRHRPGTDRLKVAVQSKVLGNMTEYNEMVRGLATPITVQGYIMSMPRQHQRGVYAPPYQFAFVVANMVSGPWSDSVATVESQKTWVDLLHGSKYMHTTPALIKEAEAVLKWVNQNEDQIVNPGQAPSGTGGGTGGSGTGQKWKVPAGHEDDSPLGGGCSGGGCFFGGNVPSDGMCFSIASVSGTQGDTGTVGEALTPGHKWPSGAQLYVTNPANGKTVLLKPCDIGAGAGSFAVSIGVYGDDHSGSMGALGLSGSNGPPWDVIIQDGPGAPAMNPSHGTQVS